jgi:hypothetical protein
VLQVKADEVTSGGILSRGSVSQRGMRSSLNGEPDASNEFLALLDGGLRELEVSRGA